MASMIKGPLTVMLGHANKSSCDKNCFYLY